MQHDYKHRKLNFFRLSPGISLLLLTTPGYKINVNKEVRNVERDSFHLLSDLNSDCPPLIVIK